MDKKEVRRILNPQESTWIEKFKQQCRNDPLQAVYTMAFAVSVGMQVFSLSATITSAFMNRKDNN